MSCHSLYTVQAEVTKFNSMKVTSNQSGAEFVDSVEAQAKILENLGKKSRKTTNWSGLKKVSLTGDIPS